MPSLRPSKSDSFCSLLSASSGRRIASSGRISLATEDVSTLLSRIARLESELKNTTPLVELKQDSSSSNGSALSSSSSIKPSGPPDLFKKNDEMDLAKSLLSLTFMEPIIEVLKRSHHMGNLEDDIFFALREAIHNPSSPWARLAQAAPSITGSRTPEQYLCMLNIAINARKDSIRSNKIAKHWKRLALQANRSHERVDVPLTPSPSDISDTGILYSLSSPRKKRLEELIEKRKNLRDTCSAGALDPTRFFDGPDDGVSFLLSTPEKILSVPDDSDVSSDASFEELASRLASLNSVSSKTDEPDLTLVNPGEAVLTLTKIPTFKKQEAPPPFRSLHQPGKYLPEPKISLKSHTCCKDRTTISPGSPKAETGLPILKSVVQTKKRMYESLAARPIASPRSTSTPTATAKPRLMFGSTRPGSIQSASSPSPMSQWNAAAKSKIRPQQGENPSAMAVQTVTQLKSSNLRQPCRRLTNSS